jgi:hypothetical protein
VDAVHSIEVGSSSNARSLTTRNYRTTGLGQQTRLRTTEGKRLPKFTGGARWLIAAANAVK